MFGHVWNPVDWTHPGLFGREPDVSWERILLLFHSLTYCQSTLSSTHVNEHAGTEGSAGSRTDKILIFLEIGINKIKK